MLAKNGLKNNAGIALNFIASRIFDRVENHDHTLFDKVEKVLLKPSNFRK